MNKLIRRLPVIVIGAGLAGAVMYALWPKPVEVTTAVVDVGPLRVTVDEDGQTRIREKYVVSAPLAGRLARVTLQEGDTVTAGQTVLASIDPADPSLLNPRAQAEAQARIKAAQAALDRAQTEVARSAVSFELAQTEHARVRRAAESHAAASQDLERAAALETIRAAEFRSMEFARDIARFELELAQAAVLHVTEQAGQEGWRFEIQAPVSGRVLHVHQESAAVVQAGTPLVEVGDPSDLELVVDVLSSDAVEIKAGAPASLERWGGDAPLKGRVRLVEPAAFTKVSALGVEEQRVNVIIDLLDPPEARHGLGDGFRVEARIVVWEEPQVLKLPTGALFRHADSWAVFAVNDGRARLRDVQVGRRSDSEAQILSGLEKGEIVVVYPSDLVREGAPMAVRRN